MNQKREKLTDDIRVWLGEKLKADLKELAAAKGYGSLSPFIRLVLSEFVYGKLRPDRDLMAGRVRDE
ncbi:Uncharacterized protein MCB1EB_1541 [Mycoavidus cysteinexigens]|uniref:Uncharacterized protein n=1 Tax=Mycoavidus cysteinexigens TaxID=1553431 RepID=A0A2Z6EWC3_9BURK|nr:hypothetical protein [Mycoavidus cysteinexigens]BBE09702.1 Uncharacterized protein MCB1EB_1541 [Mycoavidus cysteinexigens]GAM51563.1 hypothetical protein EBME_0026 [bacterium endosymbiont of Mortierella elongata FMR23-6]GLR01680.1 hypothetical protein GCM10007934_14920 [Mycoavidus cysteinexigens]